MTRKRDDGSPEAWPPRVRDGDVPGKSQRRDAGCDIAVGRAEDDVTRGWRRPTVNPPTSRTATCASPPSSTILRKLAQRDQIDYTKYATEKVLKDLLPVADNLARAIAHARTRNADQAIIDGLDLTIRQFQDTLAKSGVEPIAALGQPFDPALHQALAQVDATDCAPDTVVEEAQRGYLLHGRILRPSLVTVAKPPTEESGTEGKG